jgi:hypothetical protein
VRPRSVALLLTAVLVFYLVTLGWRGVLLIRDGRAVTVLLGLGLVLLPVLGAWATFRELRFGRATEVLARELDRSGGLPVDELPRRPGGRIDRVAADAAFERCRQEVEAAPEDWPAWFRLACAYDAAGDRRRAREAMRYAVGLHARRSAAR